MKDDENIQILIEWPEKFDIKKGPIGESLDDIKDSSEKALNLAMKSIKIMAQKVSKTIREIEEDITPDEVEVEFSIKLEIEGGVVIPFIAKTSTGGQFNIRYKWTLKPNQIEVQVS
jgi:hypothetical protein